LLIIGNRKHAGLGNHLIQSAHAIALAAEFGFRLLNPTFVDYAPYFVGTGSSLWCGYPGDRWRPHTRLARLSVFKLTNLTTRGLRRLKASNRFVRLMTVQGNDSRFDVDLSEPEHLAKIHRTRFCFLLGWRFRNYGLLRKHADTIRDFFRPQPALQEHVDRTMADARRRGDCVVGVHIRQGDYKEYMDGRYYFESSIYGDCMRHVAELLRPRKVCFLICSNVPQDSRHFDGTTYIHGPGQTVEDMYCFAQCDYVVGVPSTFSRWACFYGKVPLAHWSDAPHTLSMSDFVVPEQ
jgi:hypothetical protein